MEKVINSKRVERGFICIRADHHLLRGKVNNKVEGNLESIKTLGFTFGDHAGDSKRVRELDLLL